MKQRQWLLASKTTWQKHGRKLTVQREAVQPSKRMWFPERASGSRQWENEKMEIWMGLGSVTESGVEMAVESTKKIKRQKWTMAGTMERMRAQLETVGGSKRGNGVVVKKGGFA